MPLTQQDLTQIFKSFPDISAKTPIAVGVSGGPDSMALCWLLSRWGSEKGFKIHAITIDHDLRAASAQEAVDVGAIIKDWPNVQHAILKWEGEKPDSRILEEARSARYDLLKTYMKEHGIKHLFVAHHQDDQAETFLIRLAKGSGLDGLAAMKKIQEQADGTFLCRPLLDLPKADLIQLCKDQEISYTDDPTNENEKYLRPRLRAARDILEEEGLSSKRLSVTAQRFARARTALETLAKDLFAAALVEERHDGYLFNWSLLGAAQEELVLRVLLDAVHRLKPGEDYGPRMERMENLLTRLLAEEAFKSATLGGCLFRRNVKAKTLWIGRE